MWWLRSCSGAVVSRAPALRLLRKLRALKLRVRRGRCLSALPKLRLMKTATEHEAVSKAAWIKAVYVLPSSLLLTLSEEMSCDSLMEPVSLQGRRMRSAKVSDALWTSESAKEGCGVTL